MVLSLKGVTDSRSNSKLTMGSEGIGRADISASALGPMPAALSVHADFPSLIHWM